MFKQDVKLGTGAFDGVARYVGYPSMREAVLLHVKDAWHRFPKDTQQVTQTRWSSEENGSHQTAVSVFTSMDVLVGDRIVETVFAVPGLGRLFVDAVFQRDIPVIMGLTLLSGTATLAGVVAAVGADVPVLVDGGIRSGADVVKALAIGAAAVLVARPVIWGLVVDGAAGVEAVLRELTDEVGHTMALCGAAGVGDLDRGLVVGTSWI